LKNGWHSLDGIVCLLNWNWPAFGMVKDVFFCGFSVYPHTNPAMEVIEGCSPNQRLYHVEGGLTMSYLSPV
jgi:hypothetical protein